MPLTSGTRVGPYEVLAFHGAGGMGEVYLGRDVRLDRRVAIKVLSAPQGTGKHLERFQREGRAISRVNHPHICTIYDVGQQDGLAYLVMEFLEGETLAARLERGSLPLDRALVIAAEICDALDAGHRQGVIHRDLTPGNVMLTASGAKLLDFGLAKLRPADENPGTCDTKSIGLTDEGIVFGTLPYMAPEQVEGLDVDARTDIFALGVTLYEMTTGRRPFQGTSRASLAAAILAEEPPLVSTLVSSAPPTVDRIIRKCLAKNPDDRWQTARDLASELRWSVEGDPARQFAARKRFGLWTRRVAIGAASITGVAGALALWVSLVGNGPVAGAAEPGPTFIPITYRAGTISAARFASGGKWVVYSAAWDGKAYALYESALGSVESRPRGITEAKLLGVSADDEIAFLHGSHDALSVPLPNPLAAGTLARVSMAGGAPRDILGDVVAADWSPKTGELAVVRGRDVEFPPGTKIYESQGALTYLRVAPNSERLALFERGSVIVIDRSGTKTTLSSGLRDVMSLAWSPQGDEVWFTALGGRGDSLEPALRAVSLSGKERVLLQTPPEWLGIQDVLPDGRALVVRQSARMGLSCLPRGETQPRELGWLNGSAPEALAADGKRVLFGELRLPGKTGAMYLRATDGSDAVRLGDGYPEDLSLDGNWVIARMNERPGWVIVPTGAGSPKPLPPESLTQFFEANFLPDGRRIVFGAAQNPNRTQGRFRRQPGRIYVQTIADGSLTAISPEGVQTSALATVDGRFVIGWSDGTYVLYPIDPGATPRPLPFLSTGDIPLRWSVDGRVLYVRRDTWPPVVDRVDVATGRRVPWKTVMPADPVGLDSILRILVSPDGSYCHDYVRILSELFLVEGLK